MGAITRDRIASCYPLIKPYIRRTPLIRVDSTDFDLASFPLHLKLELYQHSGSFKARGAFLNLLTRQVPKVGVAAASGGNHGAAVAYAAMKLGIPATIFVPEVSSPAKIERIRSYGAELVVTGKSYAEALEACEHWIEESGALSVHAFDQEETLLGQGSVGLELEEDSPDVDTVLVAVGGGGLIGGIAAWFSGRVNVIGVEPETAPTLAKALAAGRPVDAEAGGIAADSLAPRRVGELMFPLARDYVKQVVLVKDQAIKETQQALWNILRVVAEPGASAAMAALVSERYQPRPEERVAVILSGSNTVAVDFNR